MLKLPTDRLARSNNRSGYRNIYAHSSGYRVAVADTDYGYFETLEEAKKKLINVIASQPRKPQVRSWRLEDYRGGKRIGIPRLTRLRTIRDNLIVAIQCRDEIDPWPSIERSSEELDALVDEIVSNRGNRAGSTNRFSIKDMIMP